MASSATPPSNPPCVVQRHLPQPPIAAATVLPVSSPPSLASAVASFRAASRDDTLPSLHAVQLQSQPKPPPPAVAPPADVPIPASAASDTQRAASILSTYWNVSFQPSMRIFLYVFSGPRRQGDLHSAIAALCPEAEILDTDVLIDISFDVACDTVWGDIVFLLRSRIIAGTIWSPPCSTFSSARKSRDGGPPPLRGASPETIFGLPGLTAAQRERLRCGTLLAMRSAEGLWLCIEFTIPFIFEQPAPREGRPHMTRLPPFKAIREHPEVVSKLVDQCQFTAPTSKTTELLLYRISGSDGPIQATPIVCDHPHRSWTVPWSGESYWGAHPRLTGRQWAIPTEDWRPHMRGRPPSGEFLTQATAFYPPAFNAMLAHWLVASTTVPATPHCAHETSGLPSFVRVGQWGNALVKTDEGSRPLKRGHDAISAAADTLSKPPVTQNTPLAQPPAVHAGHATVGGMRRTVASLKRLPASATAIGLQIAAAVDMHLSQHPAALDAALAAIGAGNEAPPLAAEHVDGVRRILSAVLQPEDISQSPLSETFPGILGAWRAAAGDPDDMPEQWLRSGAPAGVSLDVPSRGIFPAYSESDDARDMDPEHLTTEEGFINYEGIDSDDGVWEEIQRFVAASWVLEFPSVESAAEYLGAQPVLSRIGLISKMRLGILKRRIVIDAKRSWVSRSSRKYERVILPRATDVIVDALDLLRLAWGASLDHFEWFIADFKDAFWHVPLHKREQRFFVVQLRGKVFVLLRTAQGSRGAPLTWARTAALVCRLTQAMFSASELRLSIYVDDPLGAIFAPLQRRNRIMAIIVLVWSALGFTLSLQKAKRGQSVVWTSVELSVSQSDDDYAVVAQTKPALVQEARMITNELLQGNIVPRKTLRSFCGKVSHIGSLIFTLRPFAAELWSALHSDAATSGAPQGCVWTGQIRHTLIWLRAFFNELQADILVRTFSVQTTFNARQRTTLLLDASPWGLGGVLLVGGTPREFFTSPVTCHDERLLRIVIGSSAAQQTVEALAALVAFRLWGRQLSNDRCLIGVRSDSMSTLFMLSSMTSRGYGSRIVARELALCLARFAHRPDTLEHIPGIANKVADALSRRHEPGCTFVTPRALSAATEVHPPVRTVDFYLTMLQQPALQEAV